MTDRDYDLAKSIFAGELDLICPRIELRRSPTNREVVLSGCGTIRSDTEGCLRFRMVAPLVEFPHQSLRGGRPHGQLYEVEDHVQMRAVDQSGAEWRSGPLLVQPSIPTGPNWVFESRLDELTSLRKPLATGPCELRLYIPLQSGLSLPDATKTTVQAEDEVICTSIRSDRWTQRIGEATVELNQTDGHWLIVRATQDDPFHPGWAGWLCHGLEFATAQPARPVLAARVAGDEVLLGAFPGPYRAARTYLPPPVVPVDENSSAAFWDLVAKLAEFMASEDAREELLRQELEGIRTGSRGSIQTACLTIAVGVESLATGLLPPLPEDSTQIRRIDSLLDHIHAWDGDSVLRERAKNVIGSLKSTRAVDRLIQWQGSTGAPEELVVAWKRLRNRKAHGNRPVQGQQLFDQFYAVAELMYRIVAHTVGFDGPIAPIAEHGWGLTDGQ